MEDIEIINLWKNYDQKLEASLTLNRKNTEAITKMQLQSTLRSMRPLKIFTILVGIIWVLLLDSLIVAVFQEANLFFLVSAIIQVVLTQLAIGIYAYQLVLIDQVNINAPVLATQKKLTRLQGSTLWVARLLFLQLPVWTTFYWNNSMIKNGNALLWTIQILVTLGLTYLAVWLFFNIKYENRDKKWFKLIFEGKEWTPVMKAIELNHEIEAFKLNRSNML